MPGGAPIGATPDLAMAPDMASPPLACSAGRYEGTFSGQLMSNISSDMGPVTGNVVLTLDMSGGEIFTISNGSLEGTAKTTDPNSGQQVLSPYTAELEGTLNCGTLTLDNGMLKNGQVMVQGLNFQFAGLIDGNYDPATLTIKGNWSGKETSNLAVGSGKWQAVWKSATP